MKKTFVLAALLGGLGAAGCTGTTAGGRQWAADPDKPPPLTTNTRPAAPGETELPTTRLPPAQTRVSADEIDEQNYQDSLRRLESETKVEKRAMTQLTR